MEKEKIIREDIETLKGLRKEFIKKGKFKYVQEIEEEIQIMKDLLEKEIRNEKEKTEIKKLG